MTTSKKLKISEIKMGEIYVFDVTGYGQKNYQPRGISMNDIKGVKTLRWDKVKVPHETKPQKLLVCATDEGEEMYVWPERLLGKWDPICKEIKDAEEAEARAEDLGKKLIAFLRPNGDPPFVKGQNGRTFPISIEIYEGDVTIDNLTVDELERIIVTLLVKQDIREAFPK